MQKSQSHTPFQLEVSRYLDEAERDYLIEDKAEFVFTLRRRVGDQTFYENLDRELRAQNVLKVHSLREVKEGFAWVSRPATLSLDLQTLLRERPQVIFWRREIDDLSATFDVIELRRFLRAEGPNAWLDLPLLRSCLEVITYLIRHRAEVAGLFPRQLAHGQSTKLIGHENLLLRLFSFWRGTPANWRDFFFYFELLDKPLEFRFFAPACDCQAHPLRDFHGLIARAWAGDYRFSNLSGTLIIENFESFLALAKEVKSTLLIWGAGWRAVHLRHFVDRLPRPLHYWGDMDKEGYEIYAGLRDSCPELRPVMMSRVSIEKYRGIHQAKEIFVGPFRDVPGLQAEYEFVSRNGIQIEQEQMREEWPFGTELR